MDATAAAVFAQLDRELWLVTAAAGARRGGLIATFVSQASLVVDLPRVSVGLAHQHYTHDLVEASNAFALHLLGEAHLDWVWRFGLRSGRDGDKLQGLTVETALTGSPILPSALGWLDCRVEARLDTGDRTIYLGDVICARLNSHDRPLTMKRLVRLASPAQLRELKELVARDSTVDAAAIHAWRQQKSAEC
jgi:flavin reductase (DIM6/NTAB) family NADH-FMN oxidoreductase RutF